MAARSKRNKGPLRWAVGLGSAGVAALVWHVVATPPTTAAANVPTPVTSSVSSSSSSFQNQQTYTPTYRVYRTRTRAS